MQNFDFHEAENEIKIEKVPKGLPSYFHENHGLLYWQVEDNPSILC
jgi:hypothetical protein